MAKFKVTFSDGSSEVLEQSDCDTIEQYINCRFGTLDLTELGVSVVKAKKAEEIGKFPAPEPEPVVEPDTNVTQPTG